MECLLVGQPNCGKSTIFNSVVGYRSMTSNFSGVTVTYTCGETYCGDERITVTDIPGTYSLYASDEAETEAVRYLYDLPDESVLVNVIDASVLSRSLELTLQLMELQRPMMLVLNMMDEAEKKGIEIYPDILSSFLNIPVVVSIAHKGVGISEIFKNAVKAGKERMFPAKIHGPKDVEDAIAKIESIVRHGMLPEGWDSRFTAIKLLEGDPLAEDRLDGGIAEADRTRIRKIAADLEKAHTMDAEHVISSVRHDLAFRIAEEVSIIRKIDRVDIRTKIDNYLMHPVFGFLFMAGILSSAFWAISAMAELIDPPVMGAFDRLARGASSSLSGWVLLKPLSNGFFHGLGGGISIAFSFLIPFFLFLAFLEDSGYLARIAFLTDNLMHRIGLHGMSVVPLILGYGCNVPAIFATKILKSPRDRIITATLATLVPCSARMVIILGLLGALFSFKAVVLIYGINILVMGAIGKIMSAVMPSVTPGLIMEVPRYQLPGIRTLFAKTWLRLKEFFYMAIPLLVVGSIVLELINHYGVGHYINDFLRPFTASLLGLPAAAGVVLLFGILRKELALLLLLTAMGATATRDLLSVMTPAQIYSFTVFATFYIPCLATVGAIARVFNWRKAALVSLLTFIIAIVLTLAVRLAFGIFAL